jgi:hypothetical protein
MCAPYCSDGDDFQKIHHINIYIKYSLCTSIIHMTFLCNRLLTLCVDSMHTQDLLHRPGIFCLHEFWFSLLTNIDARYYRYRNRMNG